jgi:hypothetical protein
VEHVTLPNYHEKINQICWICCTKDQLLFLCTNLHKDFFPLILMNFVENKSLIWKGNLGMNVKWLMKKLFNITWIQWRRRRIIHWQIRGIDDLIFIWEFKIDEIILFWICRINMSTWPTPLALYGCDPCWTKPNFWRVCTSWFMDGQLLFFFFTHQGEMTHPQAPWWRQRKEK